MPNLAQQVQKGRLAPPIGQDAHAQVRGNYFEVGGGGAKVSQGPR